jgi:hypothetical protein
MTITHAGRLSPSRSAPVPQAPQQLPGLPPEQHMQAVGQSQQQGQDGTDKILQAFMMGLTALAHGLAQGNRQTSQTFMQGLQIIVEKQDQVNAQTAQAIENLAQAIGGKVAGHG